jgi:chromosome condensin MukBEF MukE localization factor
MKKTLTLFILMCFGKHIAQSEIAKQVRQVLNQRYTDLIIENKLLVINHATSHSDIDQQKVNFELEKTATVFQNAKLKGGSKGVICVILVDDIKREIAFKKGIKNTYFIYSGEVKIPASKTLIIDSEGTVILNSVEPSEIYSFVHSLITR